MKAPRRLAVLPGCPRTESGVTLCDDDGNLYTVSDMEIAALLGSPKPTPPKSLRADVLPKVGPTTILRGSDGVDYEFSDKELAAAPAGFALMRSTRAGRLPKPVLVPIVGR